MDNLYSSIIKVDQTGVIVECQFGKNQIVEQGYQYCFTDLTYDQCNNLLGSSVVIENFIPRIIFKNGSNVPSTPEPELTLAEKVAALEEQISSLNAVIEWYK